MDLCKFVVSKSGRKVRQVFKFNRQVWVKTCLNSHTTFFPKRRHDKFTFTGIFQIKNII